MKNKKTSSVHVNGILNKINIQLKDEEYTNEKSIQNFICSACSHSWQDKLSSFLNKKKPKGCPNCSYSRWSNYSISRYLLEYNIPFTLTSGQTIKNGAQIVQFQCTRNHIINKPFYELKAYFSRRQKNGNYCEECRATEFKQLALKNCKEKYKTKKHVILKDIQWNDRRCILFFDCKKGHSFSTDKITFTNKFYKKDFSGCMICDSQNWNIEKIKKTIKDSEFKVELLTNHYNGFQMFRM
jgi:hypothetical protein